jgi:ribosomal protein S18 acetylase RimI-like enzyme
MVRLVPMTPDEFNAFLERDIAQYAAEKLKAGNWSSAEALQRSRDEHYQLLPQGLATPGHHLFTIRDDDIGQGVGTLWLAEQRGWAKPTGFIYDLYIDERFRRRGYASRAMLALEEKAVELGLDTLALHVFGHNHAARVLYEHLGYEIMNINMAKSLKPDAPS